MNYNDNELNSLEYKEAKEIDKRTYFQFYFSLLKTKHMIIFTFLNCSDYNSQLIKSCFFLFSFGLYYTINGLFFNDSNIHKIYEDKGKFNLLYQIPKIVYSTIISIIINSLIKYLSTTEKDIIVFKKNQKEDINNKKLKLLNCLVIKFIFFFILSFLFLIFFWLYLGCFCCVYRNTQVHLIKDTLISFGLSFIYPLVINLIPGLIRIPALKKNESNSEILYKLSKLIQLI